MSPVLILPCYFRLLYCGTRSIPRIYPCSPCILCIVSILFWRFCSLIQLQAWNQHTYDHRVNCTGINSPYNHHSPLFFGIGDTNLLGLYFGKGGSERLIIYPIILYLTALGGYLSSRGKDWVKIRFTNGYW